MVGIGELFAALVRLQPTLKIEPFFIPIHIALDGGAAVELFHKHGVVPGRLPAAIAHHHIAFAYAVGDHAVADGDDGQHIALTGIMRRHGHAERQRAGIVPPLDAAMGQPGDGHEHDGRTRFHLVRRRSGFGQLDGRRAFLSTIRPFPQQQPVGTDPAYAAHPSQKFTVRFCFAAFIAADGILVHAKGGGKSGLALPASRDAQTLRQSRSGLGASDLGRNGLYLLVHGHTSVPQSPINHIFSQ